MSELNEVKRGRGRPKGKSNPNIVSIPIEELINKLASYNISEAKVSRTWLLDLENIQNKQKIEFKVD